MFLCDWQMFWHRNAQEPQFRNFTSVENLIVKGPGAYNCQIFGADFTTWVDKDSIEHGDIMCPIVTDFYMNGEDTVGAPFDIAVPAAASKPTLLRK
jgi:hypothetical protein